MSVQKKEEQNLLLNEKIPFDSMLVVDTVSGTTKVMSKAEALDLANEYGLDLYCVDAKAKTPVCKIIDYHKFEYIEKKNQKEAKRNQVEEHTKALRLSPVIDTGDFNTKLKQAMGWIESGMKVRIDMRFKGRMKTRVEVGEKIIYQFIDNMGEVADVESKPNLEGNTMSCLFKPKTK